MSMLYLFLSFTETVAYCSVWMFAREGDCISDGFTLFQYYQQVSSCWELLVGASESIELQEQLIMWHSRKFLIIKILQNFDQC